MGNLICLLDNGHRELPGCKARQQGHNLGGLVVHLRLSDGNSFTLRLDCPMGRHRGLSNTKTMSEMHGRNVKSNGADAASP